MELNEYQNRAMTTCTKSSENFEYMMLNLVGEVGELSSKVAKAIRKGYVEVSRNEMLPSGFYLEEDNLLESTMAREKYEIELRKEAGDVLWQLAGLCSVMGWKLEDIAEMNLDKLARRKEAGTIIGNGDGITGAERR